MAANCPPRPAVSSLEEKPPAPCCGGGSSAVRPLGHWLSLFLRETVPLQAERHSPRVPDPSPTEENNGPSPVGRPPSPQCRPGEQGGKGRGRDTRCCLPQLNAATAAEAPPRSSPGPSRPSRHAAIGKFPPLASLLGTAAPRPAGHIPPRPRAQAGTNPPAARERKGKARPGGQLRDLIGSLGLIGRAPLPPAAMLSGEGGAVPTAGRVLGCPRRAQRCLARPGPWRQPLPSAAGLSWRCGLAKPAGIAPAGRGGVPEEIRRLFLPVARRCRRLHKAPVWRRR